MAKRKRLSPAVLTAPGDGPAPETKALNGWVGVRGRSPIADVSADAAMQSALQEVSRELETARNEGRLVARLSLDVVEDNYLVRDRLAVDADDMASLLDSLRARGQQTPIEVVDLGSGRYGLISGWRRMQALRELSETTGNPDFAQVQALIRRPDSAADAYCAMVEENEIRSDLSFYERARIAVKAVEQGVFGDEKTAVQSLFSAARRPKQSKIVAFSRLVMAFEDVLGWPEAIPEKVGLALVGRVKDDPEAVADLRAALTQTPPRDAAEERQRLDMWLRKPVGPPRPKEADTDIFPGLAMKTGRGKVVLQGAAIDKDMIEALHNWLLTQAPKT